MRRIHIAGTPGPHLLAMTAGQGRLYGAHIDYQGTWPERVQSLRPRQHLVNHRTILQHGDHDIRSSHRQGRRLGHLRLAGKGFTLAGSPVPQGHGETGIQQVAGHGGTHQTNAKKGDMGSRCSHIRKSPVLFNKWQTWGDYTNKNATNPEG